MMLTQDCREWHPGPGRQQPEDQHPGDDDDDANDDDDDYYNDDDDDYPGDGHGLQQTDLRGEARQ